MKKILLFLSLCFLTVTVFAQTRVITGTVVSSDKNEPLVGVTIQVKGSNTATQTDVNGKFSIKVTNAQNVVLTVKYVGYNYQEHTLRIGEQNLDVKLVASAETNLNDVVVVGYGTQKKIHLTGAVATIDVKAVEDIPALNLSTAIRGQAPAVSVSGGTARPGEAATITIRNPIFLSKDGGTTDPLYIIDDVFRSKNDFNLLDQSEVESISILKDAAAAIYGVQGANGVVVVRTKRGKAGAPKVSYAGSYGVTDATQLPKMMSAYELATYLNDAARANQAQNGNHTIDDRGYIDGSLTNKLTSFYTPDELDYFKTHSNNWLKEAFQTATVQRHAVNVSGGSEKATYFAGASYVKQGSNFKGVNTDKWTFRASVDANVARGLKFGLSVSGDVNKNKRFWFKQNTEDLNNDVASLVQVAPWQEYFINGLPVALTSNTTNNTENLNFFNVQNSDNYTLVNTYVLNTLFNLTYDVPFIKGLKLSGAYNRNINNVFAKQYGTRFTYYKFTGLGENNHIPGGNLLATNNTVTFTNGDRVRLNPTTSDNYQLNAAINYSRKFGKHEINALAIYEQQENNVEGVAAYIDNVLPGALDNQNFAFGSQFSTQSSNVSEYGRVAVAGRINYNYDSKYLVELAMRADANSNFAPGKRWGYFPSASVGWVASQEGFFKDTFKFIDLFKVRASVGLLGNDASRAFQYLPNYAVGTGSGGGAVFNETDRGFGIAPNIAIANSNLTWDHNLKTNYGLDMQFLNNRLSVSADYFWEHRYDMLANLNSSVSLLIGTATPSENYGSVNTFGYELSVSWRDKIGKDWSYNFSPFLSWNDNKLIKYDIASGDIGTFRDLTGRSNDPGYYGYRYAGMFRTQADVDSYLASHPGYTIFNQAPRPGMLYFEDVRGPKDASGQYTAPDGKITVDDQTYLNNKANNHYGLGLNFGGGFRSLTLNVVMGMSFGGITAVESSAVKIATATSNRPAFWSDHWTPTNTNAAYPSPYYNATYDVNSDFWWRSSTSFRISVINLGYTFPTKLVSKLGVGSVRAYAVATNPVNFYNPFNYRDNASSYTSYPNLRSYSFGLNIGF